MSHHLLNLPLELRRAIYSHCLAFDEPLEIYDGNLETGEPIHVNLLRTCRQIHNEAAEVLYGDNMFCVGEQSGYIAGHDHIAKFLDGIGASNRSYLRNLALIWPGLTGEADASIEPLNKAIRHARGRIGEVLSRARDELMDGHADYICQCLKLLADCPQNFCYFGVMLPGSGPHPENHPNVLSDREFFSSYPAIGQAIRSIQRVQLLVLGDTANFEEVEALAKAMKVEKLQVIWSDNDIAAINRLGTNWVERGRQIRDIMRGISCVEKPIEPRTKDDAGVYSDNWPRVIENLKSNSWVVDEDDNSAYKNFSQTLRHYGGLHSYFRV